MFEHDAVARGPYALDRFGNALDEQEQAGERQAYSRGPVGIEGLTSLKYVVLGQGDVRS